jgi:hypothetical protein
MDNYNGKERPFGIGLWEKSSGNICSVHSGLTKQERDVLIKELQSDKPRRFIIYRQEQKNDRTPTHVLRFFRDEDQVPTYSGNNDSL